MQNPTEHYSFDDTTNPDDDSDTSSDPGDEEHPDVDFTGWTMNQVGEYLYLQKKKYTKMWRRFTGRPGRKLRNRNQFRRRYHMVSENLMDAVLYGKGGGR
eukprot:11399944-Karenia_brevis.AAC.1